MEQLGESSSTGGHQAAHATFSPDGSLYVVAHHNDGKLVFFECKEETMLPKDPLMVIDAPEVVPGTRRCAMPNDPFPGLPSLHHVQYSPNQKFLYTVDPSQDHIFTYTVNERGLPTSQRPISMFKCYSEVPIYGLFQRIITRYIFKCKRRARKAVIHPNGKYIYVLYESINRVQVYNISESGSIDESCCCQEISTLDPTFVASRWYPVGLALQSAAELCISKDGSMLFISNRGDVILPGSRVENSIRVFSIDYDTGLLAPHGILPNIHGPVRHFMFLDNADGSSSNHPIIIVAAINGSTPHLRSFEEEKSTENESTKNYQVVGPSCHVTANVYCITR